MGLLQRVADWFYEPVPLATSVGKASARAAGTDGIASYGGYLVDTGEANSALSGGQKWLTYTNTINEAVVATGVRYFGNLLAGTKWHCEPNESGGADAQRGVEVVTEGLLNAQMAKPWPLVVRKAAMYRIFGFSLHATGVKRRPDGLVVFSELAHRPQHTIERWLRADERGQWDAVEQRTEAGSVYKIDLDECFYCVDDTLTDSPEGVGLLRHVVELIRRLGIYQGLEGAAYQSDMGGMPIGWAPFQLLSELAEQRYPHDAAGQKAYVDARVAGLVNGMANRVKTPETQQFMTLDSDTYRTGKEQTPSGVKQWGIELLTSTTNGLGEINEVIKRIQFEIARVLGIEFALVGAEGGSYSMHEDKTSMFATTLSVTLNEMAAFATSQLARRLVRLNGLDPDTATPRLTAEPISTESVMTAASALQAISTAALHPRDPARNVLRSRMQLPPEPEAEAMGDLMAPRMPLGDGSGDEDVPDVDEAEPEDVDGDEDDATPSSVGRPAATGDSAAPGPAAPAQAPAAEALNGAQVSSLIEVVQAAVTGQIPRESAIAIIALAFLISREQAEQLLGPEAFKPTADAPQPGTPPQGGF